MLIRIIVTRAIESIGMEVKEQDRESRLYTADVYAYGASEKALSRYRAEFGPDNTWNLETRNLPNDMRLYVFTKDVKEPLRKLIHYCTQDETRNDGTNPYQKPAIVGALKALAEQDGCSDYLHVRTK